MGFLNKKNLNKQAKAIEDSKPQEQKDYEKMQEEERASAVKMLNNMVNVLREMGWRCVPIVSRMSDRFPEQFVAQLTLDKIPYDLHVDIEEAIAKRKAADEAKQGGTPQTPEPAQEVSEEEKCPEAQEEDQSAS